MRRPIVAAFRPHNEGLAKLFGSLEANIITLVWEHDQASARDIFEALRDQGHRISYGAVKTVLDRLVKKQVLARTLHGNQFQYQASLNQQEFTYSAVREIIDSLFASFPAPMYAQFLDHIRNEDPEQLEQLIEIINQAEERQHKGDA